MSKNYFYAVATLIGTIIGAGIFSVPFVTSKAGVFVFLLFLIVLVVVQYYLHKMYAEIVLSTKTEHRIPGYVEIYTGKKYKKITSIFCLVGGYGSMLAYIILGGIFLHGLFGGVFGGDIFLYSVLMFFVGSLVVLFGIKTIAPVEALMTIFLLLVVIAITIKSFGFIKMENFVFSNWKYTFLLYGPVFFSVGGQVAIPEVCRILKNQKEKIKSAIFWGTLIPAIVTAIFVVVVAGTTGVFTSPDTLTGLSSVLGNGIITFSLIFGFLSVATSFLTTSQAVKEIYWWDFKINKFFSWGLASIIPFFLFSFGVQNFTKVIGLTGAITGGIIGAILIYLSFRVQKNAEQESVIKTGMSKGVAIVLSSLFIFGLVYTLFELF